MAAKYKKRADGRYLTQVFIGYDEDGKTQYKNIYARTIKELEQKVGTYKTELEKGVVVDDGGLTIGQWALKWLEVYKSGKEKNTQDMYRIAVENHIVPVLGKYKLKDLKAFHVQALINSRAEEGLTRTLEIIKLTLSQILEQAIENEYLYKNVAKNVKLPTIVKKKKRALTDGERALLDVAAFTKKERVFVKTILYTGMRRGEILALTKNDIDMDNKVIHVNKSLLHISNQPEIKNSPKSNAGNRDIPIIHDLHALLVEYLPTVDSLYVFPSAKGALMSDTAFRLFWKGVRDKMNVAAGGVNGKESVIAIAADITPHIFRHTYATMLYRAGVDVKTAQYLLGHSTIQMTMDIYTHVQQDKIVGASDMLHKLLNPKKETAKNKEG